MFEHLVQRNSEGPRIIIVHANDLSGHQTTTIVIDHRALALIEVPIVSKAQLVPGENLVHGPTDLVLCPCVIPHTHLIQETIEPLALSLVGTKEGPREVRDSIAADQGVPLVLTIKIGRDRVRGDITGHGPVVPLVIHHIPCSTDGPAKITETHCAQAGELNKDLCGSVGRVYRMENGHPAHGLRLEPALYREPAGQVYPLGLKIHIHVLPIEIQGAADNGLL